MVEAVIIFPTFLLLLFLAVQVALFYYAGTIATAAARDGAAAAAAEDGTGSDGIAAARSSARNLSGDWLSGIAVRGNRGPERATITVTGTSLSLIPGWDPTVVKSATAPVERIVP